MAASKTVNENTSQWVTIALKDKAGTASAPTSLVYRVDCMTTGNNLVPRTVLNAPGTPYELHLAPAVQAIQNDANIQEYRRLTVEAYFGGGDEITAEFEYAVANLHFVPIV